MPVIGVGGGTATGKTTVCKLFEKWGALIINADAIGKQIVDSSPSILQSLTETFGESILDKKGTLDRRELGKIVFNDETARQNLNAIIHPPLLAELQQQVDQFISRNPRAVIVIDAALLLEWNSKRFVDTLIALKSTRKQRMERLTTKIGLTSDEAESRIDAQQSLDNENDLVAFTITNNGSVQELERQAREVWEKIALLYAIDEQQEN